MQYHPTTQHRMILDLQSKALQKHKEFEEEFLMPTFIKE